MRSLSDAVSLTNLSYKVSKDIGTVNYYVVRYCNYKCPYCLEQPAERVDFQSVAERNTRLLADCILAPFSGKINSINLTGGEISTIDLRGIVKMLSVYGAKITLFSNFSAPFSYWKDLSDSLSEAHISVSLQASLHETECDTDDFIRKACRVNEECSAINLTVKLTVHRNNVQCLLPSARTMHDSGLRVIYSLVYDSSKNTDTDFSRGNLDDYAAYSESSLSVLVTYADGTTETVGHDGLQRLLDGIPEHSFRGWKCLCRPSLRIFSHYDGSYGLYGKQNSCASAIVNVDENFYDKLNLFSAKTCTQRSRCVTYFKELRRIGH